ncbi:MAG TPA: Gfo/Idh/MocA family oxidoreductase [Verrucomicrobiae bacterium]|jgi:predicted dehydrogenase
MNEKSSETDVSRRHFLGTAGKAAAGLSILGGLSIERNAYAAGTDTIKLALVGCGGRGSGAADQALAAGKDIKLVAMADAFENRLASSLQALQGKHPEQVDPATVNSYVGLDAYKKAIADADVVILATPPGFRPQQFEEAVEQGKHVFMEKPLGTDPAGVRRILAANEKAKAKNLKVGVGFQRHHQAEYVQSYERIKNGDIGDLMCLRVYWRGGSRGGQPKHPGETEVQYQIRNWYFFTYLSGDHIVEQHCHNIDMGNWFKGGHPISANGVGGRQSRTSKECGQIYDHHYVEFTYPDGSCMISQCSQFPKGWGYVGEALMGTKGTAKFHNKDFIITGAKAWKYDGPTKDPYHVEHQDLFAAIRAGTPYNEAQYGAESTMTAIMGRMATYSGQEVHWDDAFNCQISLMPSEMSFDRNPPVMPDAGGFYPVAHPGQTAICSDFSNPQNKAQT